jgi:hypothetical protein
MLKERIFQGKLIQPIPTRLLSTVPAASKPVFSVLRIDRISVPTKVLHPPSRWWLAKTDVKKLSVVTTIIIAFLTEMTYNNSSR